MDTPEIEESAPRTMSSNPEGCEVMEANLYRLFVIGVVIGTVLGLCVMGVFLWVE